ncbi:MAG: TonB-dependent receptor, partial [Bacteroidota bacterium]
MKNNLVHLLGRTAWGILFCIVLTGFVVSTVFAQGAGTITGKVTVAKTNEALSYINVRVKGTTLGAATGKDGKYTIRNVPPGVYTLGFSAIGFTSIDVANVTVKTDETTTANAELSARAIPIGETIVWGASLRPERVTEAPAAVNVIGLEEIKQQLSHGQLPRLLETMPGVDIVQSGVQDFNINTRGFNKSINRRLLVLLDGRDLAIVLLGVQEWNGLSIPLEDLGRVELVRGPGSALYGANAYNGVINISTPPPKDILGTKIAVTGGELATFRGDVRHAGVLGNWSYKFNLGGVRTDTWTVSRTTTDAKPATDYIDRNTGLRKATFDYPDLLLEQRRYDVKQLSSMYASARFDRDFEDASFLSLESGITQVENEVFLTGIGRVHVPKARKPWGRAAYSSEHFFAQVWAGGRKAIGPHYSLQSGGQLRETSENAHIEFQHNFSALDNQLRVVWGASHRYQHENTEVTLMQAPRFDNWSGVFAQAEYKFTDEVKGVVASRFDRSTLHERQLSPKAALVLSPTKDHSFRVTFNRAFQVRGREELPHDLL